MNDMLDRRQLLIHNRDTMKQAFPWANGMMHLCCANVYTMRGKTADANSVKKTKKMLEERVGAFNNFRSTARDVLIAMLDMAEDPASLLDKALQLYDLLKRKFYTSMYLPMAAVLLAEQADPTRYEEIVNRTREIYERMKREHPFLTSSEDCSMCALLAMSDKTDDELIERAERCYSDLKKNFPMCGNQIQSMAHVMAMSDGELEGKCERVLALIDALKMEGHKWSYSYELPVLGVLAEDPRSVQELAANIAENDRWLQTQKGFGFFSSVSRMQRLMYAALLTQEQGAAASTTAVNSALANIIAEQVAMTAATSATVAASVSHYHST